VRIGAAFPSKYLKKEDIGDKRVVVTMGKVEIETVGQGSDSEDKPVLYFQGHDKGLALNKVNADAITEIVGTDETDDWAGHRICLYVDKNVMMSGKRVGGIRVMAPPSSRPAVRQPEPEPDDAGFAGDEEIPF